MFLNISVISEKTSIGRMECLHLQFKTNYLKNLHIKSKTIKKKPFFLKWYTFHPSYLI